jgi:hypothetical protein
MSLTAKEDLGLVAQELDLGDHTVAILVQDRESRPIVGVRGSGALGRDTGHSKCEREGGEMPKRRGHGGARRRAAIDGHEAFLRSKLRLGFIPPACRPQPTRWRSSVSAKARRP